MLNGHSHYVENRKYALVLVRIIPLLFFDVSILYMLMQT